MSFSLIWYRQGVLWRLGKYSTLFRNSKLERYCWLRMCIPPSDLIPFFFYKYTNKKIEFARITKKNIGGTVKLHSQWIFHSHVQGLSVDLTCTTCQLTSHSTNYIRAEGPGDWGQQYPPPPPLQATDWLSVKTAPTLIRIVTITKHRP